MANFTWEIKRELLSHPPENACCKVAACAAFLRTCGSVVYSVKGLGFELVTENDRIAEYCVSLLEGLYGIRMELKEAIPDPKRSKDKLTFAYQAKGADYVLEQTGILQSEEGGYVIQGGISPYLVENDCCTLAFLKGAFLGSGSCTLPENNDKKTGYHLEFVFSSTRLANEFCALLERLILVGKVIERGDKGVVYLKSKEAIADFLSLVGAHSALKRLVSVSDAREESNYENRTINCLVGNYDRTARASAEQMIAINAIDEKIGLNTLDSALKELALARREHPTESLQALAEMLHLSKSCISHRMRKIMEIYNGLDK